MVDFGGGGDSSGGNRARGQSYVIVGVGASEVVPCQQCGGAREESRSRFFGWKLPCPVCTGIGEVTGMGAPTLR